MKSLIVKNLGFAGYSISVMAQINDNCNMKAAISNMYMNGHSCVPIAFYLQKQVLDQFWTKAVVNWFLASEVDAMEKNMFVKSCKLCPFMNKCGAEQHLKAAVEAWEAERSV